MLNRIIRIAAVACTLLIWTGCSLTLDPAQDVNVIRFTAGSPLLRDDATKGTLKEGTTFTPGDAFLAWAWHDAANQHLSFGTSTAITLGDGGTWDYAPHQFWNWRSGDDYYDFLAVYPAGKDISHTAATIQNKLLKAAVEYDATDDQFDFMAAGLRRNDKSIGTVEFTFQHMLCAVSVKVKNSANSVNSGGYPLTIKLKSCKFVNLVTTSSVSVTYTGTALESNPGTGGRSTTAVLGPTIPANTMLAPGSSYPTTAQWDIMVPQDLDTEGTEYLPPYLEIVYDTDDATNETLTLNLMAIKDRTTNEPITEWHAGIKYSYEIELRLGVGIIVNVSTTPWEVIEAETPGLML